MGDRSRHIENLSSQCALANSVLSEIAEDEQVSEAFTVLVLLPRHRTKAAIEELPEDDRSKYKFILYSGPECQHSDAVPSLQDYLEDLTKTVAEEKVDAVISNDDCGSLLQAALVQQFPHLRGPSVESVFLGYNKYYTRCFLDPQPIPFACLDLSSPDLDHACEEALQKVGIPAFFKPCCHSRAMGVASVMTIRELKDVAQSYIHSEVFAHNDVSTKFMNRFYEKNLDIQKYPLARQPTAIVEKHMGETIIVNADGYVLDRKIFHWSISDNLYARSKPCYYFGTAFPTMLSQRTQRKVWDVFDDVVGKLVDVGFDRTFLNVEVFVLQSGDVRLMEVNPRRGGNTFAFGEVFTNGNITLAQLKLAQGENPGPPVPNGRHVLRCHIRTCGSGKAKELYDYSCTDPGLIPEVDPDRMVYDSGEAGTILCRTVLTGDSRKEVMEKYRTICSRVLLKPELSAWK